MIAYFVTDELKMVSKNPAQLRGDNLLSITKTMNPPKKLAALIELVNGFPLDDERLRLMRPQVLEEQSQNDPSKDDFNPISQLIVDAVESMTPKIQEYVLMGFWDGGKSEKGSYDLIKDGSVVERYEQLWDAYLTLRSIARRANKDQKPELWIIRPAYAPRMFLEIDEQGMLRDVKTLFFRAIEGEDIEAGRIRECPICARFFWAARITQKCCSTQCANTFRVHRHRYRTEEEKIEYELRRARREARKKKAVKGSSRTKKGK